jgi:hypothetical protein
MRWAERIQPGLEAVKTNQLPVRFKCGHSARLRLKSTVVSPLEAPIARLQAD